MDLAHLRYAVEIAQTRSISQAAENLYMGQPNLSRAIKDLEEELRIQLFRRTSHGVSVTPEGEEFLRHARSIVQQTEQIESIYKHKKPPTRQFSVCGPRSSYISDAFTGFCRLAAQQHSADQPLEFYYKETNATKAINKLLAQDCCLAIVRYQSVFENYFQELCSSKKLEAHPIAEYPYFVTVSQKSPLAQKSNLLQKDLETGIEILHADPYIRSLHAADMLKEESPAAISRKIYIFERATQFSLLEQVPGAFMWTPRMSAALLERYDLVQLPCESHNQLGRDVLLHRKGYKLTELDNLFISELTRACEQHLKR